MRSPVHKVVFGSPACGKTGQKPGFAVLFVSGVKVQQAAVRDKLGFAEKEGGRR